MQTSTMEEESNEMPVSNFFSKRAKFVPKASAEEIKAASELIEKIHEETAKVAPNVKKVTRKKVEKVNANDPSPIKKIKTRSSHSAESKEEISVDSIFEKIPDIPNVPLSAAAKRRLKKLQQQRERELRQIEAANQRILKAVDESECDIVEEKPEDNFEALHVLTITYMDEISRIKCYESDKFSSIFSKVAESFKLKVSEFLLCLREQNITVDDTPKSLNIKDTDILECIPYKIAESASGDSEFNVNMLTISLQSSDGKEKIDMTVHKVEKMQSVMEQYSKLRNIPLNQLTFEFDGEKILGTETPEDLDLESGICIDVTISASPKKGPTKRQNNLVISVDSDSNDIIVDSDSNGLSIDSNSNDSDIVIYD